MNESVKEEYYKRYERLAQELGVAAIRGLIPKSWHEAIRLAISNGDEYLNTIKLSKWDKLAGAIPLGRLGDFHLTTRGVWKNPALHGLSLSQRVSLLKHVARYHLDDPEPEKLRQPDTPEKYEEDEPRQTITQFARKHGIRISSKCVLENPHMDDFQGDHYKCTLKRMAGGKIKRMTLHFSKGCGHEGEEPKVDEVLDCLASDFVDPGETFESWARNYGYDEDSRKAEKIYKACLKQTKKIKSFLGPLVSELLECERL